MVWASHATWTGTWGKGNRNGNCSVCIMVDPNLQNFLPLPDPSPLRRIIDFYVKSRSTDDDTAINFALPWFSNGDLKSSTATNARYTEEQNTAASNYGLLLSWLWLSKASWPPNMQISYLSTECWPCCRDAWEYFREFRCWLRRGNPRSKSTWWRGARQTRRGVVVTHDVLELEKWQCYGNRERRRVRKQSTGQREKSGSLTGPLGFFCTPDTT